MKHRCNRRIDPTETPQQHPHRVHAERKDENALPNDDDQLSREPQQPRQRSQRIAHQHEIPRLRREIAADSAER